MYAFFNELEKPTVIQGHFLGGKGKSLCELSSLNINVPHGFIIPSTAFDQFLTESNIEIKIDSILRQININDMSTIKRASIKIQSFFTEHVIPINIIKSIEESFDKLGVKYVAVRSSATAEDSIDTAWAGQLETYLNITKANLLDNVKKCWSSLFSTRAIFYRLNKISLNRKISVATIVQKMVQSDRSGVAFSTHPIIKDKNLLIIEAGYGLGEAIVSGKITPDCYVVSKNPRNIKSIKLNNQTKGLRLGQSGNNEWFNIQKITTQHVLNDKEILNLAEIICFIEKNYGFPCDIEWAVENNDFYILQARPITSLK